MKARSCSILAFLVCAQAAAGQSAPLPLQRSAQAMTLPPGFKATLFAGEPDVVQPIAFTFDDRGRMWVVECFSYPKWIRKGEGRDRVTIFEDTDGDGRFDKRTVFYDRGTNLSGIALGFGGVWLISTPNLTFIPDRNGDDKPDGPPEVVLDGWSLDAKHNVAAALHWGPDGWLYGCNGILSKSRIGRPGTPDADRVPIDCGVWRVHPATKKFEAVAYGTTNPWGLDFDDYGEAFITNCVIEHLWHVVPGAHFKRMFGDDLNPNLYGQMSSCADHIHWAGGDWTTSRGGAGAHGTAGGGHAHSGAMVYLGDNWPAEYRNNLFTCNIHGNRINRDSLKLQGSGYVASHKPDFCMANDPWFRGIAVNAGPDGSAYVSDWCDTGECHNYEVVDPSNGRIYRLSYGEPKKFSRDLSKATDRELVELQLHQNDWLCRNARRLLQERSLAGKVKAEVRSDLLRQFEEQTPVTRKLRALWTLYAINGLTDVELLAYLSHSNVHVRRWAIRLSVDRGTPSPTIVKRLTEMADRDGAPAVRLALASAAARIPLPEKWDFVEKLISRRVGEKDENLALMEWYAAEPLTSVEKVQAARLTANAATPLVQENLARRMASLAKSADQDGGLELLGVAFATRPYIPNAVMQGLHAGLFGRKGMTPPPSLRTVLVKQSGNGPPASQDLALEVLLDFGDPVALEKLQKRAADSATPAARRRAAIQLLVQRRDSTVLQVLKGLVADVELRGFALRSLATYSDAETPKLLLAHYSSFSDAEKADAVQTLASRIEWARELVAALESLTVSPRDVDAFVVRQLHGLGDRGLSARLERAWGAVRPPSQEKKRLIEKYKSLLTAAYLQGANRSQGRAVFQRNCASCHVLFDSGGRIGPELTGGQRANLDYVLENLADPSAVVGRDYQVQVVRLQDGRVLNGIVKREDDHVLQLQTPNEVVTLAKEDVEARKKSALSLMPEGMLTKLSETEVRDLVAYLAGQRQAPLPEASKASR